MDTSIFADTFADSTTTIGEVTIAMQWKDATTVSNGVNWLSTDSAINIIYGPTLNISISLASGQQIDTGAIQIWVPRYVESGRNGENNGELKISRLSSGWSITADGDKVVLSNSSAIKKAATITCNLDYEFNPWLTQSMKDFPVTCELKYEGASKEVTAYGGVITQTGLSVKHAQEVAFTRIDSNMLYLQSYSKIVANAFNYTSFDFDKYVYDIQTVEVTPTGVQQYSVDVEVTPGAYPRSSDTFTASGGGSYYYGWGAEVVSAIAYPIVGNGSANNISFGNVQQLTPVSTARASQNNSSGVFEFYWPATTKNTQWKNLSKVTNSTPWWNSYKYHFTLDKDVYAGAENKAYQISVLYRFPRNGAIVFGQKISDTATNLTGQTARLYGNISVTHTGIDTLESATERNMKQSLYSDIWDETKYGGEIYASEFTRGDEVISGAVNNLRSGKSISVNAASAFYVLNPNRSEYQSPTTRVENDKYDIWCTLDSLVLVAVDSATGEEKTLLLDAGDYYIDSIAFGIRDSDGEVNMYNYEGSNHFSLAWHDPNVPPADKAADTIQVIWGRHNNNLNIDSSADAWISGESFALKDIWATSADFQNLTPGKVSFDKQLEVSRVGVRYESSQYLTALYCDYHVVLTPSSDRVQDFVKGLSTDSNISLALWTAMVAYDEAGEHNLHTGPDSINAEGGSTAKVVRAWENVLCGNSLSESRYYRDYHSTMRGSDGTTAGNIVIGQYAYRKFFHVKFDESKDSAGYSFTRYLMSGGSVIGNDPFSDGADGLDPNVGAAHMQSGSNIDTVIYSISPGLFDGAGTNRGAYNRDTIREYVRSKHREPGDTAYRFQGQRTYILLPEGMEYAGSVGKLTLSAKDFSIGFTSHISNIIQPNCNTNYSSLPISGWTTDGIANELQPQFNHSQLYPRMGRRWIPFVFNWVTYYDVDIQTEDVNGRQLLCMTVKLKTSDADGYIYFGSSWTNYTGDILLYGMGVTMSFAMRTANGEALPTRTFDVPVITEYLDADGNSYDLTGFSGPVYSDLKQAFPTVDFSSSTLLSENGTAKFVTMSDSWTNLGGNSDSVADIAVNGTSSVELEDGEMDYIYSISYALGRGIAKNVVVFASLENSSFAGSSSEWQGIISSVDTNGTNAEIWVNNSSMDYQLYAQADYTWLQRNGWRQVTNLNDSAQFAGARSIAVYFKDSVFKSVGVDRLQNASVYVHMRVPEGITPSTGATLTNYSTLMYSNYLNDQSTAQTAVGNEVRVSLHGAEEITQSVLPETGGTGTAAIVIFGAISVFLVALYAIDFKRRKCI